MKNSRLFYLQLLAAVCVSLLLALPSKTQHRVGHRFAVVSASGIDAADIVDLKTNSVTLTLPAGSRPLGVSITPDGHLGMVANFNSGSITFIDLKANPPAVIETMPTTPLMPHPESIAITPNGKFGIVADGLGQTDVVVIDLEQRVIVSSVSGLPGNHAAVVSRDGKLVLILSADTNEVAVLNLTSKGVLTDTGQRVMLSGVSLGPRSMAMTPNGHIVLVTDTSGVVTVLSIDGSTVSNAGAVTGLDQQTSGVAITNDGKKAYISSLNSMLAVLSIGPGDQVLDTGLRIFVPDGTPTTFFGVPGLAITPDGRRLFIAGFSSGRVSILDTATDTLLPETISVGSLPAGIAMPGRL